MASPATAKSTTTSRKSSLQDVYKGVETLLKRYVPPFQVGDFAVRGKDSLQLVVPKPVAIPGAYGGKPVNLQFAAVIFQKGYVGFYLMGVHTNAALKKKISPVLLNALKGKSCFHLKTLDEQMKKDIATALDASARAYRERGWL